MADGTQNADLFTAPAGNSSFNGFGGVDTIVFNFALTSATIHWIGNQVIIDTPSSRTVLSGFEVFQFTDGTVHNDDGNPLVDDLYYYWNAQDVWAAHVDADAHYNTLGWHEGRNPSAFFNTNLYLATNPDVAAAGVNPLLHFDAVGWTEGRQPSLRFDMFAYLQNNPDVAAAHIDPLAHFLQFGHEEGRLPNDVTSIAGPNGFDYAFYLAHNPDVAASGVDAFQHFLLFGWKEGRNPNAYFDAQGYLATYTDVAAAGVNPFLHFITFGWKEGRNPSPAFDTSEYLLNNPDVAAAQVNPLEHFLQFGVREGRVAFAASMFDEQGAASILPEGAANGTSAGIDSSWGGWISPALSFSIISDTSGGGFAIDPVTGIVTVGDRTKLDFESSGASHDYTIVVQAEDGGFTATQSYTIGITDVLPTTPVDSNAAADAVAEGAANGTAVGVTLFSDEPNGPAVTYELTNTAGGRFAVDPSTGVVTVADTTLLDFESSGPAHTFTITGRATIGAIVTATQSFTITVLDAPPSVPVDANGAGNLVLEGDPTGTLVGITVSAADPNGPLPTYSLTDSAGGRFQIDSLIGVVTIGPNANLVDFESSGGSYSITAQATVGGLSSSQTFTINIGDVAPTQPIDGNGGTNTVAEGATTGAVVGVTASSTDVNGGLVTYSFAAGGDAGGRFQINTSTGVISVSALGASTIDYETSGVGHSYDVTVQATDGTLLSTTNTFTIAVSNVAPTQPVDNDGGAGGNILEGSATGTAVGITGFSTDPANTTISYSLTNDAVGRFQIDSSTGVISVSALGVSTIDFETQPVGGYSITIQASDGQGGTSTQSFLVAVANAAPDNFTDTNGGVADSVTEGVASGQATGLTVNATDPAGTTVTYSLTNDAGGRFQINTSTGEVLTGPNASLIDFETSLGSYTITVQASDGAGGLGTTDFLIAVADAPPGNWSDLNAGANLVTEGDASNTLVSLQANAIDPNGGTVTYSFADLAASAGGRFKIDSATGVISVDNAGLIDFETSGGSYAVTVTATTAGGTLTSTNGFTIDVADLAPPQPADIDAATNAVTEGALAGVTVGIEADSLDVNGGNVAYTLTNSALGLFAIDSVTGVVTVTAAGATGIDFESSGGSYVITVQASDGTLASTESFTIAVGNAAPAQPTDANASANVVSVVVPRGCSLRVPTLFMDAEQKAVARNTAQRLHTLDAYLDMKDRVSRGMRRHRVVTPEPEILADGEEFDHRAAAYDALKKRLGTPKAKRQPKPAERHGWRV